MDAVHGPGNYCSRVDPPWTSKLEVPRSSFDLAPVVQKVDKGIHRINHYPLDSAIGYDLIYNPLDCDLSGG